MMTQSTLAIGGFDTHSKDTRKVAFLARMDKLVPCSAWEGLIEPHYPKAGIGRPPRDLSIMPRMYCVANWFDLADEACEDALYELVVASQEVAIAATKSGARFTDPHEATVKVLEMRTLTL